VAKQLLEWKLTLQGCQYRSGFAGAHQQGQASCCQVGLQFMQTFQQPRHMPWVAFRAGEPRGFDDEQCQRRTAFCGGCKWSVVRQAQVALEPHQCVRHDAVFQR
jgi:hypothetical protein